MKKISAVRIIGILLLLASFTVSAQEIKNTLIQPDQLSIAFSKTTNLIFPYAIKSVDKGSRDILVQKAIGVENVLQVKAAKTGFQETNLTIVTSDGSLYSYILNYSERPSGLNIKVRNASISPAPIAVFNTNETNDLIQLNARKVLQKRQSARKIERHNNGVCLSVKGVYVQENELYLQISIENKSVINFDTKLLRYFIKDKKKSKRTSSQELDIIPVYVLGDTKTIRSNSEQSFVVAVSKFTIPDKKTFIIQMQELNGGRNLELKLENKDLLKAGLIN